MSKTDTATHQLLDFVAFTHQIRNVKRAILLDTDDLHENDSEHCYQLALVGWFLIENDGLQLDAQRVVGLAMVHDIAEAYAGDTNAYASVQERKAHTAREKLAIKKLQKEWPTFVSLHELIEEYETRVSPESQFVYALDKLLPMINNLQYEGRAWRQLGISLERMKTIKEGKIDLSETVNEYYESILAILETKPELFGS